MRSQTFFIFAILISFAAAQWGPDFEQGGYNPIPIVE